MTGRRLIWIPFLAALPLLAGCPAARYIAYLFYGGQERDVKAAFSKFPGKSIAVVVYCDKRVQYEYPELRLNISSAVATLLHKHAEAAEVVDPRRVVKYQDERIDWDEMDRTELGKSFEADYLLFISLVQFSTREPGSMSLYRGRASAEVSVYDTSLPERDAREWKCDTIHVIHPEHAPTGEMRENDVKIRQETIAILSDKVAKKFYDHKEPIE
jgi:hypothetical protein